MIREANEYDCINLAALSLEVWFTTYSIDGVRTENSQYALSLFTEEYFKKLYRDPKHKVLLFHEGIYLRGYILVNLESQFKAKDNGFEIEKLYVQPPFQNRGIGKELLSEVKVRYGSNFWLYTWIRNKSIGFYKNLGFEEMGYHNFTLGNDIIENIVLVYRKRT